ASRADARAWCKAASSAARLLFTPMTVAVAARLRITSVVAVAQMRAFRDSGILGMASSQAGWC
ncbi:conserved hypothetical protein, partial [Ricinus communis]